MPLARDDMRIFNKPCANIISDGRCPYMILGSNNIATVSLPDDDRK